MIQGSITNNLYHLTKVASSVQYEYFNIWILESNEDKSKESETLKSSQEL